MVQPELTEIVLASHFITGGLDHPSARASLQMRPSIPPTSAGPVQVLARCALSSRSLVIGWKLDRSTTADEAIRGRTASPVKPKQPALSSPLRSMSIGSSVVLEGRL